MDNLPIKGEKTLYEQNCLKSCIAIMDDLVSEVKQKLRLLLRCVESS